MIDVIKLNKFIEPKGDALKHIVLTKNETNKLNYKIKETPFLRNT